MTTKPINELHTEHTDWLKRLDFYTDEITIMKNRIAEIAAKNTSHEILAQVEHFQNSMIIQKNNIDELRHSVKDHENYLENRVEENPVSADKRMVNDHPKMRESMNSFETNFNAIRHELNQFLAKSL
jgi:hypothetical protein